MGWLVGQILCAAAFLAGVGVTLLAFVRRTPRPRPVGCAGPTGMAAWAAGPREVATEDSTPVEPPPPPPPPAADPALAAIGRDLDGLWRRPGAAAAAADALDLLGVAPAARPADTGPDVAAPAVPEGTAPTAAAPVGGDPVEDGPMEYGPTGHSSTEEGPVEDGLAEDGPVLDGLAEDGTAKDRPGEGPAAEDDAREDVRTETAAEPRRSGREVSTDDIPAQGGPVEVPLQIPVQAGPRDNGSRPNGNGRT
jgi:hypothetical protein